MNEVNIFEQATRLALRFQHRSILDVEDLWQVSLTRLDDLHMQLTRAANETKGESLLQPSVNSTNQTLRLKIAIVKHIFTVKLAEKEARDNEADTAYKKQKLLAALERAENNELDALSPEEIRAQIEAL